MPEYKASAGRCVECDVGQMVILRYPDGEPNKTHQSRIRTKCDHCNEAGSVSSADARADID